jgi:DNA invertase Pin-like site-specific DNA recombinase
MEAPIVGYYRVSSEGQAEHGLSLEAQRDLVHAYARKLEAPLVAEFTEIESAYRPARLTLEKRPALLDALTRCKRTKSMLVIAALDRLARNVVFIASLIETRVRFTALDIPDATPFMIHIYAAVAEEESRQRGELLRASIAIARARGVTWAKAAYARSERVRARSESLRGIVEEIRATGISGTTLTARELNRRGIAFQPGKLWATHSARTLLEHLGLYAPPKEPWSEIEKKHARARQEAVALITCGQGARETQCNPDLFPKFDLLAV